MVKKHKLVGIHIFEGNCSGEIGVETIKISDDEITAEEWEEYGEDAPKTVAYSELERNDATLLLLTENETKKLIEILQKALKEDIEKITLIND